IGRGCPCIGGRPRRPSLQGGAAADGGGDFYRGGFLHAPPLAGGGGGASAGIFLTMVSDLFRPLGKAVTMQPAVSPVVRSAIAGRPAPGYSVLKDRVTGPIFAARTSGCSTRFSKTARALTRSDCSLARSVGLGTMSCSTLRAAPRLPATALM